MMIGAVIRAVGPGLKSEKIPFARHGLHFAMIAHFSVPPG